MDRLGLTRQKPIGCRERHAYRAVRHSDLPKGGTYRPSDRERIVRGVSAQALDLLIAGVASAYAWDVVESARRRGHHVRCVDNHGGADPRLPRLTPLDANVDRTMPFTVGLASPRHRPDAYRALAAQGFARVATLVDPTAVVASTVTVGHGVYVNAAAVVASHTVLGCAVNVNRSASLGHDNILGWGASIGPGATTGGHVRIGAHTLLGVGSVVRPEVVIGPHCTVGAGAVVIRDVEPGSTVVGNPARVVSTRDTDKDTTCPFCSTA